MTPSPKNLFRQVGAKITFSCAFLLSYCKFFSSNYAFFCLIITLICSEGLAGMMVRSDFNRPFVKYLISVKLWKMAVHLAIASDVLVVSFCAVFFPHEMSWIKSKTELSQFLGKFSTYF